MNKKHIGSNFDDFLKKEKIYKKIMKNKPNFSNGKCGAVVRAPKGKP